MKILTVASDETPDHMPMLPLDRSVGYQIRRAHRLLQRALQVRTGTHEVTLGMWYFLRALWDEDGLTQRELSARAGTMEPTTLSAIAIMERNGFVERKRNNHDRRKVNVYLTERGRALERELLPAAIAVVKIATRTFTSRELDMFLGLLSELQKNLSVESEQDTRLDGEHGLGGEQW